MDDNAPKENPPADFNKLDLSQLQGFSFGTQWTQEKPASPDRREQEVIVRGVKIAAMAAGRGSVASFPVIAGGRVVKAVVIFEAARGAKAATAADARVTVARVATR